MATLAQDTDLPSRLLTRIASNPDGVWTPGDFADLGGRAADPDGQTLLVWYPEIEPHDGAYVRPAVRIKRAPLA